MEKKADTNPNEIQPDHLWGAFGRNLAAGFGALSALLSLLAGSSVTTASFRGAIALFGVLFATRIGSAALRGIASYEGVTSQDGEDPGAGGVPATEDEHK